MSASRSPDPNESPIVTTDGIDPQPESMLDLPPFDIPHARIPHLGHTLLFLLIAGLTLFAAQGCLALFGLSAGAATRAAVVASLHRPKLQLAAMAFTYLGTLGLSALVFPLLWRRPFLQGIHWNGAVARRRALGLVGLGLAVGWIVQAISSLIEMPKSLPMNDFFHTPSDVWVIACFGTLLAPLAEEITFRGFLLPAFAIAFDWLSLPREPHAVLAWQRTDTLSRGAFVFSGVLTSVLFALLHAQQLAHAWEALVVLGCVSLILTTVRVRTQSVAASTLVHASYNLSIFITLFLATGGFHHLDKVVN